jgi:hypothetical protein
MTVMTRPALIFDARYTSWHAVADSNFETHRVVHHELGLSRWVEGPLCRWGAIYVVGTFGPSVNVCGRPPLRGGIPSKELYHV